MDHREFMNALRETFRRIREEKGISQHDLSRLAKKPQSVIARFETGKDVQDHNIGWVKQLCDAIDLPIAQLLAETTAKKVDDAKLVYDEPIICLDCDEILGYSKHVVQEVLCDECNDKNKEHNGKLRGNK